MNFVSWFEIPVYDIHRAAAFYNAVYGFQMELSQNGEHTMALFPAEAGVGGALVAGPGCVPSDAGVLVYLNASVGLDPMLERVELAGGRVVMPRSFISEQVGSFALFIDSEGNRLALHEPPAPAPAGLPGDPSRDGAVLETAGQDATKDVTKETAGATSTKSTPKTATKSSTKKRSRSKPR